MAFIPSKVQFIFSELHFEGSAFDVMPQKNWLLFVLAGCWCTFLFLLVSHVSFLRLPGIARMLSLSCDWFGIRNKCPKRLHIYVLRYISFSFHHRTPHMPPPPASGTLNTLLDAKRETKIFFAIFKLILTAYTNIVKAAARFSVQLIRLPWIRLLRIKIIHKTLILL